MANTPKKSKDPTELALSAIEEALNVRDNPPAETPPSTRRDPVLPTPADRIGPLEREEVRARPSRRERNAQAENGDSRRSDRNAVHPAFEEPAPRRAANDDRESVGNILRALQRRPSKTLSSHGCSRRAGRSSSPAWCSAPMRPKSAS